MKILKKSISVSMFVLGAVLLMFNSCEKNDITTNDSEMMFAQESSKEQNTKNYEQDEALVYLEIPEEYLAQPDEEMVVIEENGPFYTEDGEEIEGSIMIETTVEGGTFFTIRASHNLVDLGLINNDLHSTNKPWIDYYNKCMRNMCSPPPPNMGTQRCHGGCTLTANIAWIFQI